MEGLCPVLVGGGAGAEELEKNVQLWEELHLKPHPQRVILCPRILRKVAGSVAGGWPLCVIPPLPDR